MRLSKRHRWFESLALGLTVAAIAAPPGPGRHARRRASVPDLDRRAGPSPLSKVSPECPNLDRRPGLQPGAPESSPAATPTGFDYGDAGIGAVTALGATLLAAASFWALRRVRRPTRLA